jgi:uncharacterized protein (DUF1015 family)
LVLEDALGLKDIPTPTYVHQVQEVIDGLSGSVVAGHEYSLAAMVMPASLDQIRALSLGNERMPAKSTYFYPKLAAGLVVHSME